MTNEWPKRPVIYEINTWVWLDDLSSKHGRKVTLGTVPSEEWDRLASLGVDAVWLMGIWERSPTGRRIAFQHKGLMAQFHRVLPDFTPEDMLGSAYCVRRYVVDERLGGSDGLATAREHLSVKGLPLVLDFVPNHIARDQPLVLQHPEFFIQGSRQDLERAPNEFFESEGKIIACGRDPYFPPWEDVAQVNAFHPGLRDEAIETVSAIAAQCDGMRCDMAMLLINSVFERTWGDRAGKHPSAEYWAEVIKAVRSRYPFVLFVAEAYWDFEWELQQLGFDFCYDKRLYDRLVYDNAEDIRAHLLADLSYQEKLVRFIENHDEPRVATAFSPMRGRAAAVIIATLPGAKLFHEGQFEGWKTRLPVFLRRHPQEKADNDLKEFYQKLLNTIRAQAFREGQWQLCRLWGWPDNSSHLNLLCWCWYKGEERFMIVVNFSHWRAQGLVQWPWPDAGGRVLQLTDVLSGKGYKRNGDELLNSGLYVDLDAWHWHFLKIQTI